MKPKKNESLDEMQKLMLGKSRIMQLDKVQSQQIRGGRNKGGSCHTNCDTVSSPGR